jgi:hypothetical protein
MSRKTEAINAVVEALADGPLSLDELRSKVDPRLVGGIDAAQVAGKIKGHVSWDGTAISVEYRVSE